MPLSSLNKEDLYENIKKYNNPEIAIRLNDSSKFNPLLYMFIDLSLRSLEDMLVSKAKSEHMMQKNNEALLQYVEEIKNLRNLILNDIQDASSSQPIQNPGGNLSNNRENILRKALKCKQLEDDNKKLRKLLKTQIENSE